MKISKLFLKYSIFLLIIVVIERFVEPYAMKLYFSLHNSPYLMPDTIQQFQAICVAVSFVFNLIITVLMIFDSKNKRAIDWIIFALTFFFAEAGIPLFLVWQSYKDLHNKYEAQRAM